MSGDYVLRIITWRVEGIDCDYILEEDPPNVLDDFLVKKLAYAIYETHKGSLLEHPEIDTKVTELHLEDF